MRRLLLALSLTVAACATPPVARPRPPVVLTSKAYFVGTWRRGAGSYAAAAKGDEAWRLTMGGRDRDDGVFATGQLVKGKFRSEPNRGPSGPGYTKGWRREGDTLTLDLDGASEDLIVVIDGPDRWRFEGGYFVRQ
jgi:hypothetical protein